MLEADRSLLQPDIPAEGSARVVIAIADANQRSAIAAELRDDRALTVEEATSWDGLKTLLDEFVFDLVVLSDALSGLSPIEVNSHIKSFYRQPPATILLGPSDVRSAVKAFRCGFADYLTEEARVGQLIRDAVSRAAKSVRERREERQHLDYLERLAQRDGVTGLPNHHVIEERMEQLTHIKARYGILFAVILIRINEFEHICGGFGHKMGDKALVAFAKKLTAASRTADTVARLSADTFIYLVDREVTPEAITGACRRLARTMAFSLNLADIGLTITPGIGPALFPTDGSTVAALLASARARFGQDWESESLAAGEPPVGEAPPLAAPGEGYAPRPNEQTAIGGEAVRAAAAIAPAPPIAAAADPMDAGDRIRNRRRDLRRRTLKRGLLILNQGYSTVNCIIRDVSVSGVRVAVEGRFLAPDKMELMVADTDKRRPVEKRWQRDDQLGLMFLDLGDAHDGAPASAADAAADRQGPNEFIRRSDSDLRKVVT